MSSIPAKQRLEALKVDEISLVDTPANEAAFLVVKRQEPAMNSTTDATQNVVAPVEPAAPETPVVKAEEAHPAVPTEIMELAKAIESAYAAKQVSPGMKVHLAQMHDMLRGSLTGASAPGAGNTPVSLEPSTVHDAETKKELGPVLHDAKTDATGIPPLPIMKTEEPSAPVEKAGRKYAAATVDKLKATFGPLLELLLEADPDGTKAALAGILSPIVLAAALPQAAPAATAEPELAKKLDEVEEIKKRLERLENVRGVTKAIESNENASPSVKKSFWNGVV